MWQNVYNIIHTRAVQMLRLESKDKASISSVGNKNDWRVLTPSAVVFFFFLGSVANELVDFPSFSLFASDTEYRFLETIPVIRNQFGANNNNRNQFNYPLGI